MASASAQPGSTALSWLAAQPADRETPGLRGEQDSALGNYVHSPSPRAPTSSDDRT